MTYKEWCKINLGYEVETTYYEDFTIAEHFGYNAVRDTYKRALLNKDYKMMTELTMVLNHKIWEWHNQDKYFWAELYDELWRDCDKRCCDTFNKEELAYYYKVTD